MGGECVSECVSSVNCRSRGVLVCVNKVQCVRVCLCMCALGATVNLKNPDPQILGEIFKKSGIL